MTEARMSDGLAQSGRPNEGNSRALAKNLLHLFAKISAIVTRHFWRPHSASGAAAENCGENAPKKAGPVAPVVEDAAIKPSVRECSPAPITADMIIGGEAQTNHVAHSVLDGQEIRRRRDLVRTLFNDFWSGADEKPAAFVDRLVQAEPYINERLIACGEFWQLNAETRITLGLPSTKNKANPRPS